MFAVWLTVAASGREPTVIKEATVILGWGSVEIERKGGGEVRLEKLSESSVSEVVQLNEGDTLRTTEDSSCDLVLTGIGSVRVRGKAGIRRPIAESQADEPVPSSLEMLSGKLFIDIDADKLSKRGEEFRLKTPVTILAVRGTMFFVVTGSDFETAGVHEGSILLYETESKKHVTIEKGQKVMAKPGAVTKARPLTAEEQKWAESYRERFEKSGVSNSSEP